jgi:amino acid transporter
LGRAFTSERLAGERLPKRLALPTFSSDTWSSIAYAPDQILLTLALAGVGAYAVGPWVGVAVVLLLLLVVLTASNTVHEYPSGGGDYEVVRRNLGTFAGRLVGSALLVDYVLTVAVSTSQAASYISGALPTLHGHEMAIAVVLILVLAVLNLRGVHQSSRLLAIPVYLFIGSLLLVLVIGAVEAAAGSLGTAPSADLEVVPDPAHAQGLLAVGSTLLVLRAFASGCVALTGVEAVGNGVPSFRPPKARNATIVLIAMGVTSAVTLLGVMALASATGVRFVEDPTSQLREDGQAVSDYHQLPVIGQITQAVSSDHGALFYLVTVVTGLVLFLAAHTAFNGFPNLASVLARDAFLPRQLRVRGERLAYSNGILALAAFAAIVVWATRAQVTVQIQMYIVGVFVAMGLAQFGMVRHFTRRIRLERRPRTRHLLRLRRVLAAVGCVTVFAVLLIVLTTKFTHGAWAAIATMAVFFVLMSMIHRHYTRVSTELALPTRDDAPTHDPAAHPSRSHAVVLLANIDGPTLRALSVASASRPSSLEVVLVQTGERDLDELLENWRALDLQYPLRILYSPYREIDGPILRHVRTLLERDTRGVVIVYLADFQVGPWWEALLHNHSARRLGRRLAQLPRVVVATVPWQLGRSSRPALDVTASPTDQKEGPA